MNNSTSENVEDFLKNLDIQLATLEKFGSALLVIGYALFVYGADLDIKETLDINNTGLSATTVTLYGAELILYGYIILFIVADKRFQEKIFENNETDKNNILSPYFILYAAYFGSIILNIFRVGALAQLDSINKASETFV